MSIRFRCKCGREFAVPDDAAGKKAKCLNCGQDLTVPRPHRTAGPHAAPPPAAKRTHPARPAAPPAEEDVPMARLVEETSVPMAQLIETAAHSHRRTYTPSRHRAALGSVKVVLGIVTAVILWMAMEVIVALAVSVRQGLSGIGWLHALWLVFLVIGFFMAAAAARGSRFCIGLLLGGAFRGVINGLAILVFVTLGDKIWIPLPSWMMIYGLAALGLAVVYIVLLLISADTRKHLHGHGGEIAGSAVMGVILGGILAPTAMPGPLFLVTRTLSRPAEVTRLAAVLDAPELIGTEGKESIRNKIQSNMVVISRGMADYINKHHNYFPQELGAAVNKDCPPEKFLSPATTKDVPKVDRKTGKFSGPVDVIYVLGGYHLFDLPDTSDELRQLVVCYSDPNCHFGDGAVVMRAPVGGKGFNIVGWLEKDRLADELRYTRRWMKRHPPRAPLTVGKDKD